MVVPWGVDQFDNALRLRELGVGVEHRLRHYRAPSIATKLRDLVDDKACRSRCRDVAARFDENGLEQICDRLEAFSQSMLESSGS